MGAARIPHKEIKKSRSGEQSSPPESKQARRGGMPGLPLKDNKKKERNEGDNQATPLKERVEFKNNSQRDLKKTNAYHINY